MTSAIIQIYQITDKNFEPFHIVEKYNIDHSKSEWYMYDVAKSTYADHRFDFDFEHSYHNWSKHIEQASVLTKTYADQLFSHLINHHRGDNYNIVEIKSYEQLLKMLTTE